MLVAIRHKQSDPLAVTLSILQPQLAENDDIYVIDTTSNREGWNIVKKYGTSRSVIFAEVGNYSEVECINFFDSRARLNHHKGILYLDNVLFSNTFISNLKKAIGKGFDILQPDVLISGDILNPNFKWYNPPTKDIIVCKDYIDRCVYFHLDSKGKIGMFPNEKIVYL